jgi:hypothetical protein
VDEEDYLFVSQHKWHPDVHVRGGVTLIYARTIVRQQGERQRGVRMHRMILGNASMQVDHEDGNGLNNTRQNLRAATHTQNMQNSRKRTIGSSRYKGVQDTGRYKKRWQATVICDGRRAFQAYFYSEEEAARAYDVAARKLFGLFAAVNFPMEE